MKKFILFFFFTLGALGVGGSILLHDHYQTQSQVEDCTLFIDPGTPLATIAHHLHEAQLIPSPWRWVLMARLQGKGAHVKAGEYEFKGLWTPAQVLDKLVEGKGVIHFLTLPEGLTVGEMRDRIQAIPLLQGTLSQIPREGTLFPETYAYKYGDRKEDLLQRLHLTMEKTLNRLWEERDSDLPYNKPEDLLTLASIIEKETSLPEERPRVAGVFINRLRKRMPLQADPTLLYGLGLLVSEKKKSLTKKELKHPFPYNTYLYPGLPPTPIACPSLSSLEAAAHPLKTTELYFVADGTGAHQFASTLAIHQKNHSQWRLIRKKQEAEIRAKAVNSPPV